MIDLRDGVSYGTPSGVAPPVGLYSHYAIDNAGTVYISGQVGTDETGALVGPDSFEQQYRRAFANILALVDRSGCSTRTILKLTTYLVRPEDLPAFRTVRQEMYQEAFGDGVYPPHSLFIVAGLSAPNHLVELEAVASLVRRPQGQS